MRSQEFVTELVGTVGSMDHLINRVNKVADICATMGNRPLLYRMLRGTSTSGRYSLIQKVTPRGIRDEKLLGTGNAVQPHVLNKLDIEHAVFATMDPHPGTSGKFGANFFMVPIGSYKIYSSPAVDDLGTHLPAPEDFDKVVASYKEGWPSAGFPNEVILDCEQYYMILIGEFVKKYAGEKVRQMYTRDTNQFNKIKNDINKELLTSSFKTYNDMAWYLRNPVTNLLKAQQMKAEEILKEGLMYKGYPCTKDCSGHMAGYAWAQQRNIVNPQELPTDTNNSFYEGMLSFTEGKQMKIKDIVREDTDSGDIATVATNLFARPIKRTDKRKYGNTPKPQKYKSK